MSSLTKQLDKGSTGRLTAGSGADAVRVFILNGSILASESDQDAELLLRRLTLSGAISSERSEALRAELGSATVIASLVEEVDEDDLGVALYERFRDNLATFMTADKARFSKLKTMWCDNVQLGHDADALLGECTQLIEAGQDLDLETELVPGGGDASNPLQRRVLDAIGAGLKAADLIASLPIEPVAGRATLARMLQAGILAVAGAESEEPLETGTGAGLDEDPTVMATPTDDSVELDDDSVELDDDSVDLSDDTAEADDDSLDETVTASDAEGAPKSFADFQASFGMVDEEVLDAFGDYEDDRGQGAGGFSTQAHNLDKVDVVDIDEGPEEEEEEALAADEATASYSAPVLSEDDAEVKVQQANESLVAMAAVVDEAKGSGAGRAAVQLLVDGTPLKYKALYTGIQVSDEGALPVDGMLDNLYTRPATEHRNLLSGGLIDLIERGLDIMGDDLDDDQFDRMYESVGQYRQKLAF